MAVAVVQEFPDGSLEVYDKVVALLDLKPGGPGVSGGLFHWVTEVEGGGVRITDVWESKEAFEKFAETLAPLVAQVGAAPPASTVFYDVHNYFTGA